MILKRGENQQGQFGRNSGGVKYGPIATVWADVQFVKGMKAMREGALDAYDRVMIRMRYNSQITRDCRLQHDGTTYQIESFHADRRENKIQITATEIA